MFDIFFSFMGIIFLSPVFILLWFIGLLDNGSPLFLQKRLGQNLKSFVLKDLIDNEFTSILDWHNKKRHLSLANISKYT